MSLWALKVAFIREESLLPVTFLTLSRLSTSLLDTRLKFLEQNGEKKQNKNSK
jgi:hypothetical protein